MVITGWSAAGSGRAAAAARCSQSRCTWPGQVEPRGQPSVVMASSRSGECGGRPGMARSNSGRPPSKSSVNASSRPSWKCANAVCAVSSAPDPIAVRSARTTSSVGVVPHSEPSAILATSGATSWGGRSAETIRSCRTAAAAAWSPSDAASSAARSA
ncbi:hypothetical protein [Actinomadura madurae]|uniref:hypothetical protein n=1 Tax=Actinomadura madurae TaxID=1993 RepID=UPI0020D20BF1|nr:hypothetical protein [Actinomadura madurae]MCQ0016142.1 hypothetical protein [Actinomadura madurae]